MHRESKTPLAFFAEGSVLCSTRFKPEPSRTGPKVSDSPVIVKRLDEFHLVGLAPAPLELGRGVPVIRLDPGRMTGVLRSHGLTSRAANPRPSISRAKTQSKGRGTPEVSGLLALLLREVQTSGLTPGLRPLKLEPVREWPHLEMGKSRCGTYSPDAATR